MFSEQSSHGVQTTMDSGWLAGVLLSHNTLAFRFERSLFSMNGDYFVLLLQGGWV